MDPFYPDGGTRKYPAVGGIEKITQVSNDFDRHRAIRQFFYHRELRFRGSVFIVNGLTYYEKVNIIEADRGRLKLPGSITKYWSCDLELKTLGYMDFTLDLRGVYAQRIGQILINYFNCPRYNISVEINTVQHRSLDL